MTALPVDASALHFGAAPLCIEDVVALARGHRTGVIFEDAAFRARISAGAEFLDRLLAEDGVVYGVTTGYGAVSYTHLDVYKRQGRNWARPPLWRAFACCA